MYEQVPMVEIDGMNLVQTRAILRYIAAKYDLYGRNLQEQAWIDMYVEGLRDLSDMIMFFPLSLPEEKEINLEYILQRATTRFFPVYEKALRDHRQDFLVGNRLSWADVQLLEVILMVEECNLQTFPEQIREIQPSYSENLG
nr:glutathione S-transferase-like [Peromyscus maniculatus bairdii]